MMPKILLKWGGLKGWEDADEAMIDCLRRFHDDPVPMSTALHHNTHQQVLALLDLIDATAAAGGRIVNDWSGEDMTPEQAKAYVIDGNPDAARGILRSDPVEGEA